MKKYSTLATSPKKHSLSRSVLKHFFSENMYIYNTSIVYSILYYHINTRFIIIQMSNPLIRLQGKRKKTLLTEYELAEVISIFEDSPGQIMEKDRFAEYLRRKRIFSRNDKKRYISSLNNATYRNFNCHIGNIKFLILTYINKH